MMTKHFTFSKRRTGFIQLSNRNFTFGFGLSLERGLYALTFLCFRIGFLPKFPLGKPKFPLGK